MRRLLLVLSTGLAAGILWFVWVVWVSPQARAGHHNQYTSHLIQPGMSPDKALAIMGPPAYKRTNPLGLFYAYTTHPFASGEVTFWVGPDSLVAGVSHGE
jgi:hypothetical protein